MYFPHITIDLEAFKLNQTTSGLPSNSSERKAIPLVTGVLDYFPDALAAVAKVSKAGNDKHNPGEPLHWTRGRSTDHADSLGRHLLDRGGFDPDTGQRHSAEMAWRALALLQQELEEAGEAPLSRASVPAGEETDRYASVRNAPAHKAIAQVDPLLKQAPIFRLPDWDTERSD